MIVCRAGELDSVAGAGIDGDERGGASRVIGIDDGFAIGRPVGLDAHAVGRGQRSERQIEERNDIDACRFSRIIAASCTEGDGEGAVIRGKRKIHYAVKTVGEWNFEELPGIGLLEDEGEGGTGAVWRIFIGWSFGAGTPDLGCQSRSAGAVLRGIREIYGGQHFGVAIGNSA